MAEEILRTWNLSISNVPPRLLALVRKRQKLLSDAWLSETGHLRPGMNRGLPLPQALPEAEDLKQQIRKEIQTNRTVPAK